MAEREFNKVLTSLWTTPRFYNLGSVEAQLYYHFLSENAHISSVGCYRLPDAYARADLRTGGKCWEVETQKAAVSELIAAHMIAVDAEAEFVLIKGWFQTNPLMNPKHAEGARRRVATIASDKLREECEAAFLEAERAMIERLERAEAARLEREAQSAANGSKPSNAAGFANAGLAGTRYLNGGAR